MTRRAFVLLAALGAAGRLAPVAAQAQLAETVRYDVAVVIAEEPRVEEEPRFVVTVLVPARGPGDLVVGMPRWRPGRYEFLEFGEDLLDLRARGPGGQELSVERMGLSRWRVEAGGAASVTLTYGLGSRPLDERTRHLGDRQALLWGAATFVFVEGWEDTPVSVSLDLPEGWSAATPLDTGSERRRFVATDYQELAETPIALGRIAITEFEAAGVPYRFVTDDELRARLRHWLDDLVGMATVTQRYFGSVPFERYTFILHEGEDFFGGTESWSGSVIQLPTGTLASWDDPFGQARFELGMLFAHELAHAWNLMQLRPQGLMSFEPLDGNRTELLWFAEGGTMYLEFMLMGEAGVIEPETLLATKASFLNSWYARTGPAVSLAQASLDIWSEEPEAALAAEGHVYDGGMVNTLLLDLEIVRRTEGARSLRDVFRFLEALILARGGGYTTEDLAAAVSAVTGDDLGGELLHLLDADRIDRVTDLLESVGLREGEAAEGLVWWGFEEALPEGRFQALVPRPDATDAQRRAFERWSGITWPEHWSPEALTPDVDR
jgi:predicted metalloprotease with PDZ domain